MATYRRPHMALLHADISKPAAVLVTILWCGAYATLSTESESSISRWQLLIAKLHPVTICFIRLVALAIEYWAMKKATSRVRYHRFAQSFEYRSAARLTTKPSSYEYLTSCQYKPLWTVLIPPVIGFGAMWYARALPSLHKATAKWAVWDLTPYMKIYMAVYQRAGKLLMVETGVRMALELLISSAWVGQTLSNLLKHREFR
jgi:hypothetical protein